MPDQRKAKLLDKNKIRQVFLKVGIKNVIVFKNLKYF